MSLTCGTHYENTAYKFFHFWGVFLHVLIQLYTFYEIYQLYMYIRIYTSYLLQDYTGSFYCDPCEVGDNRGIYGCIHTWTLNFQVYVAYI